MKWIFFGIFYWIGVCAGSNILIMFTVPGKSHGILGSSLVNILLDAGHQVTYVTPFPIKKANPALTVVDISSVLHDTSDSERLDIAMLATKKPPKHLILRLGYKFASQALHHVAVQELLEDTSTSFDVVIAEWFYSGLLAPVAAVFNCPLIWYWSSDIFWEPLMMVHEASTPAYSVHSQSYHAPKLPYTVTEKAHQLWLQVYLSAWMYYMRNYVEEPTYREIFSKPLQIRGQSLPEYETLVYNASLLLTNSHLPLGQNVPLPQNVKYVGGHHLETNKESLDMDLKKILDESTNGVIYFSMGSNLKCVNLQENIKHNLIKMFGQLEQTVIWKLEEKLDNLPRNVHISEWMPQENIMKHPNISVFITQGGLLSLMEATYNGVPIIGIPIFGDQYINVDHVVNQGYGLRVDFAEDFPWKIKEAVNEILGNVSYKTNAKFAASIFRRRLASPKKELLHWVQLVADTRGALFLRSPAVDLSFFEKLHFDILFIVTLFIWFFSKVVRVFKVHFTSEYIEEDINKKEE